MTEQTNANTKLHKIMQDLLAEERERFRMLMQQSPAVIELYDLDGLQIEVNHAYETLWGFPASHTVGKFNVLKSKEVEDTGLIEYVKKAYAGQSVAVPEYEFDSTGKTEGKGEGRTRWLNTRIFPLKDNAGNVKNIVITHEDVSDRKYTEQILRQSEERFRSIVENSEAGYFFIDKKGIIRDVNDAWIKMHKYSSIDEVIGKHYTFSQCSEDIEAATEFLNGIMNNDPKYMTGDFTRKCKDGSTGYHNFSARAVIRKGKITGVEGFMIDVTKTKEGEQERERLMKMLESKNEELQSIVYISSHDLKTPLINIDGFSGSLSANCEKLRHLLGNENISDQAKDELTCLLNETIPEDLKFITEGTKKMKILIDGLLQVSRVGTVEIKIEDIDMNAIIENIITNVTYKSKEINASITAQIDLPTCHADANQINQLFSNLIDNAIKYLDPKRKGEIHISGHSGNGISHYCVKDNGIGIHQNHQNRIFEVYHRLDPADSAGGEGLGLTIIKRILDRHNGSIRIDSVPDEGSEFFVSLPCDQ